MWFKHGLKAQKLLAQGNTLGIKALFPAPCKGKSLEYMLLYNQFYLDLQDECLLGVKILYEAFALTGRIVDCECTQGVALGGH